MSIAEWIIVAVVIAALVAVVAVSLPDAKSSPPEEEEPERDRDEGGDGDDEEPDDEDDDDEEEPTEPEEDDGSGDGDAEPGDDDEEEPENRPPEVSLSGPNRVRSGGAVRVSGEWSDPDGDEVTVKASLDKPRGSSAILERDGSEWTFAIDRAGVYAVTLTASDGQRSSKATHEVEVYPHVSGTYRTRAVVESASGVECGGVSAGDERTRDVRVRQPAPTVAVPDLKSLIPSLAENPRMLLRTDGSATWSGVLEVDDAPDAEGTIEVQFNGSFTGHYELSIGVFCTVTGTLEEA